MNKIEIEYTKFLRKGEVDFKIDKDTFSELVTLKTNLLLENKFDENTFIKFLFKVIEILILNTRNDFNFSLNNEFNNNLNSLIKSDIEKIKYINNIEMIFGLSIDKIMDKYKSGEITIKYNI